MKRAIVMLAALMMVLAVSGSASAATQTANLNVSVAYVGYCIVTTTPVNFGSTSSVPVFAQGDISVNCTAGLNYNIALDAGSNYNEYLGRGLSDTTTVGFHYNLYKSSNYTYENEWGDSDFGNTYASATSLSDIGNGSPQSHTVYGWLDTIGASTPGTYTDTVVVTVHY